MRLRALVFLAFGCSADPVAFPPAPAEPTSPAPVDPSLTVTTTEALPVSPVLPSFDVNHGPLPPSGLIDTAAPPIDPCDVYVVERGDTLASLDYVLEIPGVTCGDVYRTDPAGYLSTGDWDFHAFRQLVDDAYTFRLTAENPGTTLVLQVYDHQIRLLGQAFNGEDLSLGLVGNQAHVVAIIGYLGPPSAWTLEIERAPLADITLDGHAAVGAGWVGDEAMRYTARSTGATLCEWTWDAIDWESDPTTVGPPPIGAVPCEDPDGNRCAFDFAVNLSAGRTTQGDCAPFGLTAASASALGPIGYGYTPDYQFLGNSYGPALMYYVPAGYWIGLGNAAVVAGAGTLTYTIDVGVAAYAP